MIYYKEDISNKNKIDILPMIDIIFAILSFLIISSLYLSRVDTIPIDLPKATSSLRQDRRFINIFIDKSGGIFLNKKKILTEEILDLITNMIKESNNLVVLHADKNASYGDVVDVLDRLRSINRIKIAISTNSLK
tara:strand:+ start:131 stop:535 length:405 start_codon:yes stop_codon:yes gene_type:complete